MQDQTSDTAIHYYLDSRWLRQQTFAISRIYKLDSWTHISLQTQNFEQNKYHAAVKVKIFLLHLKKYRVQILQKKKATTRFQLLDSIISEAKNIKNRI